MNKFTKIIQEVQKELHYSSAEMRNLFPHLFDQEYKESLRLAKRRARITRYKLIKK